MIRKREIEPVVHKGCYTQFGIFNYCDDLIRGNFSRSWAKVTCKKCLKKDCTTLKKLKQLIEKKYATSREALISKGIVHDKGRKT